MNMNKLGAALAIASVLVLLGAIIYGTTDLSSLHREEHVDRDAGEHTHARHFNPDFRWGDLQRALRQRKTILRHTSRTLMQTMQKYQWDALGPGNIGGRILAIYLDPSNTNHIVLGAAGGGIWNSTDGGSTWNAVNDFLGSLAVNAIVRDPVNGVLYAGTGEFDAGDGMVGAGLFTSTDNGNTWSALASTNPAEAYPGNSSPWYFTTSLAFNSQGVLLASTWQGIERSTDGGNTWQQTYTGLASQVVFDPNNPANVIADISPAQWATSTTNSVIAYSNDAGQTWTDVTLASSGQQSLTVNAPATLAGNLIVGSAQFNPTSANVTGNLVEVTDSTGAITDGCNAPFVDASAISGNVALLLRGTCNFTQNVENAQVAGATGVVVIDNVAETPITMGGTDSTITIPSFMINQSDGNRLETTLQSGSTVNVTLLLSTNPNGGGGRVRLGYAQSMPDMIYAIADYQEGTAFKSTDGGKSWNQLAVIKDTNENIYDTGSGDQGGYDDPLWVDPMDANHLIAGGIDLWQSTDGGQSWSRISDWTLTPNSPHADHHVFAHNGTTFYDGNDGGLYSTDNLSTVTTNTGWVSLNNGLGVTQFYSVAGLGSAQSASNSGASLVIGGTQDNGCVMTPGGENAWTEFEGGDGGFSAIDPSNGDILYCEYSNLDIERSMDGGTSVTEISLGIQDARKSDKSNFISPFVMDPNNPKVLLAGGTSLWRTQDATRSPDPPVWSNISGGSLPSGDIINAIAVAKGNSDEIWVGFNGGTVWFTHDGTQSGPTWTQAGANVLPTTDTVNRIVIDPANANSIYVMYASFAGGNLWHSNDGGTTWTNLSPGLPDAPIFDLVINPQNSSNLFVATEVGIFVSTDGGNTWGGSNDGPANIRVVQFDWFDNEDLLAATHGRGIWKMNLAAVAGNVSVSNLEPASATVGGGTFTLTVSGAGFTDGATVSFDGVALTTNFVSAGQLTATVPSSAINSAGTFNVLVTNPAPDGYTSNSKTFIVNNPTPTIDSLSPTSITTGSTFTLTINGDDFVSGCTVNFGNAVLTATFVSSSQVTVQVPASSAASSGTVNVTVTNPQPNVGASNSATFSVAASNQKPDSGAGSNSGNGGGSGGLSLLSLLGLLLFSGMTSISHRRRDTKKP